ncbi:hypothetical protein [Haloprofundus salinisoli]|uniref:hypothetical protein n=1 Tax=Haloprofundus salinisoli TaxID=2876193 RepID=UPI001CCB0059|nr:hypothetical protein [Haloprofundus salinisoli]
MDTQQDDISAIREFEQSLKTLLVEAFAQGVPLEGRWQVTLDSPNLPDWSIQITKEPPVRPEYTPDFIEE